MRKSEKKSVFNVLLGEETVGLSGDLAQGLCHTAKEFQRLLLTSEVTTPILSVLRDQQKHCHQQEHQQLEHSL